MKIYEIDCKIKPNYDIALKDLQDELYKHTNFAIDRHCDILYKDSKYSFGGLVPLEQSKIYKKGKQYFSKIRTLDEKFAIDLQQAILKDRSAISISDANIKELTQTKITELYSVTPVTVSVDDRFWVDTNGIELLKELIQDNLLFKYHNFFNVTLPLRGSFIESIEVKNKHPLRVVINDINMIGNKITIIPKQDINSQKLAFTALALGIGENNLIGCGFCIGK
ncbi:MAG: CRISPR/Cas system-associated protein Cas6, type [Pseudomonadota bacterium]|jgi:CRISPR-associated endoribonuclease Cas6